MINPSRLFGNFYSSCRLSSISMKEIAMHFYTGWSNETVELARLAGSRGSVETERARSKQQSPRYESSASHANSIGKFDLRRCGVIAASVAPHLRVRSRLISARYVAVAVAGPRNSWKLLEIHRTSRPATRDPILSEVAMPDLRWMKLKTRFGLEFRETEVRLNHSNGEYPRRMLEGSSDVELGVRHLADGSRSLLESCR